MQQLTTWLFSCFGYHTHKKSVIETTVYLLITNTALKTQPISVIYNQIWKTDMKKRLVLFYFLGKEPKEDNDYALIHSYTLIHSREGGVVESDQSQMSQNWQ